MTSPWIPFAFGVFFGVLGFALVLLVRGWLELREPRRRTPETVDLTALRRELKRDLAAKRTSRPRLVIPTRRNP